MQTQGQRKKGDEHRETQKRWRGKTPRNAENTHTHTHAQILRSEHHKPQRRLYERTERPSPRAWKHHEQDEKTRGNPKAVFRSIPRFSFPSHPLSFLSHFSRLPPTYAMMRQQICMVKLPSSKGLVAPCRRPAQPITSRRLPGKMQAIHQIREYHICPKCSTKERPNNCAGGDERDEKHEMRKGQK